MTDPLEAARRLLNPNHDMRIVDAEAVARALLAREQAVADAYRRGQEDAATLVERLADESECCDFDLRDAAAAIRALPTKEPMS